MLSIKPLPMKPVLSVFFALLLASALSHQSGLDLIISRSLYAMEGASNHGFAWNHNFWLYTVIHEGGRALVKRMFFLNLACFLASWFVNALRPYRQAFLLILISTLVSTSMISSLKHITTIPCPYSLIEFGGDRHWVPIWRLFASDLPHGSCYPAGHSSGGYAWLCLAFVFPFASKKFFWALLPGLALGMLFGIAQQLRGAHFLSHDLLTIALCWLTAALVLFFMQRLSSKKALAEEEFNLATAQESPALANN